MVPEFNQKTGVNKKIKAIDTPLQAFSLYFDTQLMESFCEETHLYFYKNKQSHSKKSHHKQSTKPTLMEIKCMFGMIIKMGIIQKPNLKLYFSTNELYSNKEFKNLINMERFQKLISCLSFIKKKEKKQDAQSKIQSLIDYLIERFQLYYLPESSLTIDETMIKFNSLSQIKFYILTESKSGYALSWNLSKGKKQTLQNIIKDLVSSYMNKGYTLSFDRFYSSIPVIEYLTELEFIVYSAINKQRLRLAITIQEQITKLSKHQSLYFISQNNKVLLTVWRDSKVLFLLSNTGSGSEDFILRQDGSEKREVACPENIIFYQKNAKGVGHMDQMVSYYNPNRRSNKWYIRILYHLLQVSIHNSYIIYKAVTKRKVSLLGYQQQLIVELIHDLQQEKLQKQQQQQQHIEKRNTKQQNNLKDCQLLKGFLRECEICSSQNRKKKVYLLLQIT